MSITCIIKKCEESWEEEFVVGIKNKNNCSGFIKTVAQKLGILLPPMQADGLVDSIEKSWTKIGTGSEAAKKATEGFFVIAGLKSGQHSKKVSQGHVVIIINGPMYRAKYPKCWGGSTGSAQSKGDKSVGEVWNTVDRDNVAYYMYKQPVCINE